MGLYVDSLHPARGIMLVKPLAEEQSRAAESRALFFDRPQATESESHKHRHPPEGQGGPTACAARVVQADDGRAHSHRLVQHLANLARVRFGQRA